MPQIASPNLPGLGHTGFVGMSLPCPPLLGKAMKLFFSTSPKALPLRFNLTPVHRGHVFGIGGNSGGTSGNCGSRFLSKGANTASDDLQWQEG